ncbi:S1 RNA-binding domain-containing protein [Acetohalobium arabaticum]|uniref:RNA binding S1 domain protein n=1 Tax=Acetohalobium arabaticum (strain ATCC 49924 / DSM 5501 / Z-7288) TaxID=574087 RepID=D9QSW5_ACEAZ|nr:S1 RNA-binding domain-containing protein [Acetohalobium arabaticum]ADL11653.1 RNA binding S1 domain protein [Acetohalobium arabaticum DSM 5501]
MSVEVGSVVEGKVSGITNFGAFVELSGGETGLIHISEIADTYVKDVNDYLEMNEEIEVKVISIDDDGKIGLSLKQLEGEDRKPKMSFEKQMKKFIEESDEKQKQLKKSIESKRGGGSRY